MFLKVAYKKKGLNFGYFKENPLNDICKHFVLKDYNKRRKARLKSDITMAILLNILMWDWFEETRILHKNEEVLTWGYCILTFLECTTRKCDVECSKM